MPSDPPIDFQTLAKAAGKNASDYPYSIKSADLMANFVFATLEVSDGLLETNAGLGGHQQRRLKIQPGTQIGDILYWSGDEFIPVQAPASTGKIHVLASKGSAPFWIATEECQ